MAGKSNWFGELSKRTGTVISHSNRNGWGYWGIPTETVYSKAERGSAIRGVTACNLSWEFYCTKDPCNQRTDREYLNLKKRTAGCMIEKISLWSFSLGIVFFMSTDNSFTSSCEIFTMDIHSNFDYSIHSDLLLYAVIPVTVFGSNLSIQVNPRCCKCEVTSYYLKKRRIRYIR